MRAGLLLLAAAAARAAGEATTSTASLPTLRDDCQLTLSLESPSGGEARACEPVALTARLTEGSALHGAPVGAGWITFAADGAANPPLPVPLGPDGRAAANVSGLLPGVRQLTATFIRGGGHGGGSALALGPTARPSHCQEGTSPPIAVGVTRAEPAVSVTAVPAGGLEPASPTGCDLGRAVFYVSVTPKPAFPGGPPLTCASPTGVVSVYLVRGSLAADQVGEWDGLAANAAAAAVSGLRDGAATAVSAATTAVLGGGGGDGTLAPAAQVAAGGAVPGSASVRGPGSVLPGTLTALVQAAQRTVGRVGGGGGGVGGGGGGGGGVAASASEPAPVPAPAAVAAPAVAVAPLPPPPASTPAPATAATALPPPVAAAATAPPRQPTPAPVALSTPSSSSSAGNLHAALRVFVDTFNAEVGGGNAGGAEAGAAVASLPGAGADAPLPPASFPAAELGGAAAASSALPAGEVAPAKARGGRALLALPTLPGPLSAVATSPPFSNLAASARASPLGHRLLGVGVLVPSDFLPGAPAAATVKPGSRSSGAGGVLPRPPPPGSPGGPAPLLPGQHTAVVQYSGDENYERGVGVVGFAIADGCGVL